MIRRAAAAALILMCAAPAGAGPRLVLLLTVDQLRGDMLARHADRFGDGGFAWLLERGVVYTNAHFRHATTFTSVGHATLVTGGNPPEHGIAGNDWWMAGRGRVYSVEDPDHRELDGSGGRHDGTSPRNLTSSTIGDELIVAGGGRPRVFSVSVKDRGAILPAGRLGKAFWYSSGTGRFVTSTYYYDSYPAWVNEFNDAGHADRYAGGAWTLLAAPETYVHGRDDDRAYEVGYRHLDRTFPHELGDPETPGYYAALRYTPAGDELTVAFAAAILEHEGLGLDDAPDLLAVSLSCTDYVGHAFGPESLEAEDNLLRLDRTVARMLAAIDEAVGLERTIVVLSSDHGIDTAPEHRCMIEAGGDVGQFRTQESGRVYLGPDGPSCGAGRHFTARYVEGANAVLRERFEIDTDLVAAFWNPGVFLDTPRVAAAGLDLAEVEAAVAAYMLEQPGIARAVTRSDLLAGRLARGEIEDRVARAFHPTRSPNVILVQEPHWFMHTAALNDAAMHGSPHHYDTHVPVIFAVPGVAPATVHRRVGPGDVAPTLAILLKVEAPSGSVGEPLAEVLSR